MQSNKLWPEELSFLESINGDRFQEYRHCPFLTVSFDAEVWILDFGKLEFCTLDFRLKLENGSLLTDETNRLLLDLFKCWICIQSHSDITGGKLISISSAYNSCRRVFSLIDYFLLNAGQFKLSQYGLMNVTENDIFNLLAQLASSNETSTSIYQLPIKLTEFLKREISEANINELNALIENNSELALDIPDEQDCMLQLDKQEIIYARAILWDKGYYKSDYRTKKSLESYRFSPDYEKLFEIIYPNTIRAFTSKPQAPELLFDQINSYVKEYPRASVTTTLEETMSVKEWSAYRSAIRSLGQLKEIGLPVTILALNATDSAFSHDKFSLKETGRFKTVPNEIVLKSLRQAIEFTLSNGKQIFDSAIAVIEAARKEGVSCFTYSINNDIRPLLDPKIQAMGVRTWNLRTLISPFESRHGHSARLTSTEYFQRLRNNEGLFEVLRILFGAIQFSTGTLVARRQAELLGLIAGRSVDLEKRNLIFDNGKSGIGDIREKEARPIPPVAVKMIDLLEHFHKRLQDIGASNRQVELFSYPNMHTGVPGPANTKKYNSNLDLFCDYFETGLNDKGERYYMRQHQLRRFFAMLFFWGNSFGGMETLRWFLGHTDIEHLYHYITESTPGYVLRASKAQFGSEIIRTDPIESKELADIIEKHFGTREFSVLDSDELQEYIEELLLAGHIEIEPIFFMTPDGQSFRIAIKVKESPLEKFNG